VRKDVECVFGRMKMRFRCLLNPIFLKSIDDIDNLFFCAAIFHNMLLAWDGFDTQYDDVLWGEDIEDDEPKQDSGMLSRVQQRADAATDLTFVGNLRDQSPAKDGEEEQEISPNFNATREALVNHFTYLWDNKRIKWLGQMKKKPSHL
jgi:hypothetical protein